MSLSQQIAHHHRIEGWSAMAAVREYQRGNKPMAEWYMADAAKNRHLAYELNDTHEIAQGAFMEYHESVMARRRAAQ